MCYNKLRIVTNGKKFKVQFNESYYQKRHLYSYDLKRINSILGDKLVFREDPDTFTDKIDLWNDLNKNGVRAYNDFYGGYDSTTLIKGCPAVEFSSKNAAIKWIKDKFGAEGLKILNKVEEQWKEV